jgi:parallel beta-helix repeat protein
MILDKAPRALICAGFFCLAAALGDGARAAEVYPGCAQPGPTEKVWWVDQINGKSPTDGGDGSQAHPWNSLNGIISGNWGASNYSVPGYTRPLLASVPYWHRDVTGKIVDQADTRGNPPVQPGDTIELMSGNYGDVALGDYNLPTTNSDFVVVKAAMGQTPVFDTLWVTRTNKWVFDDIKVQSLLGTNGNNKALVTINDQGAAYPTTDIILVNMLISSVDDASSWTQAQWLAQGRSGYREVGSAGDGTNGVPYTTCVAMTGSHISNVRFGVALMGNNSILSRNEIDHFGDDGIDYGASNISITHNYIHDNFDIADGNHEDVAQGQNGPLLRGVPYNHFSNILIDSNLAIRQTDPKLAFPTYLQGIDAFDEEWTNVTVTNNVVVTSACWGIFFSSVHNGKIINNTVVADGLIPQPGNCKPLVVVGDKTHEGSSSSNNLIRNNIANGLSIDDRDPNMTMDHNICLGINGRCQIVTYVNGKPKRGVFKPGEYADHNIIDRRGAEGMFVGFDPAKFVYDLRLKSGAIAIGAGNPAEAPPVDITGAPRGSPVDVGAYQHGPDK